MIKTSMGEYIVGAYFKMIKNCDFISYNVRPPGGGIKGLNEIDVVVLDFENKTAYLCEVTTHIRGTLYGKGNKDTIERIRKKYDTLRSYADEHLASFTNLHFMFWSPYVPRGYLTSELEKTEGLELVINEIYTKCIDELREKAKKLTHDTGNPFFRTLQILEQLR